jgi:hypothetical protein
VSDGAECVDSAGDECDDECDDDDGDDDGGVASASLGAAPAGDDDCDVVCDATSDTGVRDRSNRGSLFFGGDGVCTCVLGSSMGGYVSAAYSSNGALNIMLPFIRAVPERRDTRLECNTSFGEAVDEDEHRGRQRVHATRERSTWSATSCLLR